MAVSSLAHEVSDICLGKLALRSLLISATVGDALSALKRSKESYFSVWICDHSSKEKPDFVDCRCAGKICMVDIICYLCKEKNLFCPSSALKSPISVILPKASSLVKHVQPHSKFSIHPLTD